MLSLGLLTTVVTGKLESFGLKHGDATIEARGVGRLVDPGGVGGGCWAPLIRCGARRGRDARDEDQTRKSPAKY